MPRIPDLHRELYSQEERLRQGGGEEGVARQRRLGRMTARERIAGLLDEGGGFFELALWSAYGMYPEWGEVPAAGVVGGIGWIDGRPCMVVANDATVKAGAMFPQSIKKVLRLQRIASQFRLPLVYLVDSSGVFLPLQDDVFPDEDDFGRIFRNNAVLSADGIPQFAAIMGNCVAGGAYLPVLCDTVVMTEGSHLYLAAPALVKAAIGQDVDPEELGGAAMHAAISGTADFREPDDPSCLRRLRSLFGLLPRLERGRLLPEESAAIAAGPAREPEGVYDLESSDGRSGYDVHDLLACVVDRDSAQEYKAEYGPTLVTMYARIGGRPVGIVANQKRRCTSGLGELQIGGVLYPDGVDKAARFVMDCNQSGLPIVFFQDVQGFMVGKAAERSGIIRAGAKLVNVVSNSVVPKITVIVGGSFGAGNYALCGKAYDPSLILAWPNARYAVMGPGQASETLLSLQVRAAEREGRTLDDAEVLRMREAIRAQYEAQSDIRYGAARGWVDAIIAPHETRRWLDMALRLIPAAPDPRPFRTGVLQV
ncbi:Methylmalonyl-CoA carboxyltransferase 12S subunit [Aquisphaera giovannonii]|uniref:Methylmalonyl-CoA carboxyltransferase 12S subunit n=1 Tax=Aquisphaera giovannonii TaxID=406548 RepID=A0A5B9W5E3_9BACT|nr:acyl-CoA carboxylase subunit beta [Aquisphaera giovannonii]QEH35527.1 Methylmalonyl-CoA carboxyltransferase 12S subunit [Aquisphaera giovannonii]